MASTLQTSMRLANRVAIVTGSSSGLGRAIALAFAANGSKLVVCSDLRPNARGSFGVQEADVATHDLIRQRYGEGKAVFVKADATISKEIENLVSEAAKTGGRLDVMINNAGTAHTEGIRPIHEMDENTWDTVMRVNGRSTFLGSKFAVAQFLRQSPLPNGHRGWIINSASILGVATPVPGAAAYSASKGAVVSLTKQVAVEYAKYKIHCNALCPGYLKTPMTAPFYDDEPTRQAITGMTPWGEWGDVEDVAKCAVFLASEDANYITGLPLAIDGGMSAQ
ncbi:hypothetical protein MMC25_003159 [Agyrium rufum]|nr:hypothetical protein [Agyrium rufum]